MIKVCHMTSAHRQEDVRIFHKECCSLAQAGYEVYLVSPGETYDKNGVHIIGIQKGANRLDRILHASKRAYQAALALDADVYHFHDPELLPYGLKLKRKGKKVIFDSHECYTLQFRHKPYLPGWCSRILAWAYGYYEHYVVRRLDGLVVPSLIQGKNPLEGVCKRRAFVNNVPKLEAFYDRYDPAVPKYPRSICYTGSLTYARGITHLVKAAAKADCTLYLAGWFAPAEYQQQVQALPEFSHAVYLGPLSREQILDTLQHCQIGMATLLDVGQYSRACNLATKSYEYMSVGLPVIMTSSPYNETVCEKYRFGLCVAPDDIEGIASAIRRLLDDPDAARQMGENGRRAVKEEFNWSIEEKNLLKLYEDILND